MFSLPDCHAIIIEEGTEFSAYEDLEWINALVAYVADIAVRKPSVKIFGLRPHVQRKMGNRSDPRTMTNIGRRVFGVPVLVCLFCSFIFSRSG